MPNHEYALTELLEMAMPEDIMSRTQAPLLTLTAEVDPDGQASATLPVGWCAYNPAQLVEQLKSGNYRRPHLLLVVRHKQETHTSEFNETFVDYTETGYYVVPITQRLVFINFTRPGKNEIVPIVVDVPDFDTANTLRKLSRTTGRHILTGNGSPYGSWLWNDIRRHLTVGFKLEVNVPAEMFAPEPKPWMRKLVQRFYGSREREADQCHFRYKLFMSLLTVVPFIVLGTAFKLLTLLVGLLLTRRRYNLRHLARPLYGKLTGVWSDIDANQDHTYWWHDKHGNSRPWPFWVYNHLTVFAVPAAVFGLFHIPDDDGGPWISLGWWETFLLVNGAMFGFGLVFLACALIVAGVVWLIGKLAGTGPTGLRRKLTTDRQSAYDRRREEVLRELSAMACNGTPTAPSLDALPASKWTVNLLFHDLKAKVCRPFAR